MKMIADLCFLASLNNCLILLGPTPTYISQNYEAELEMNLELDSPAIAFANIVFPVPGGP